MSIHGRVALPVIRTGGARAGLNGGRGGGWGRIDGGIERGSMDGYWGGVEGYFLGATHKALTSKSGLYNNLGGWTGEATLLKGLWKIGTRGMGGVFFDRGRGGGRRCRGAFVADVEGNKEKAACTRAHDACGHDEARRSRFLGGLVHDEVELRGSLEV